MTRNRVIELLGRKLRLAVIGGGPGSFIGPMHRVAARMDDRYEIVASVLSSNPEKSIKAGIALGIEESRAYGDAMTMLDKEKARADGADVVAIMTPNDGHFPNAVAALDRGFDVICDKPMTNTLEDAKKLYEKVRETGLVFCLTHNYTGYPMVRQAKAMVEAGELGEIRLIQVEYVQGGNAMLKENTPDKGGRPWKYDPAKGGPSLVMGDIGSHAHNLVRFITGLEVDELTAEIGAILPGRKIHDFAGALLRMDNGARCSYWVTQAAAGMENSLQIRVSGSKGTVEWQQEIPQRLSFKPIDGPSQIRTPNGPGSYPLSSHSCRIVKGHPEGFPESFANIYSDAAEAIAARRSRKEADPLALYFPSALDGYQGIAFVHAVIESSRTGQWVKCKGL